MKKIIFAALSVLFFVACEKNEPEMRVNNLRGTWSRETAVISGGTILDVLTFGENSLFIHESSSKMSYENDWQRTYVNGRYAYEGTNEGELRIYDQTDGESVNHATYVFNVIINGCVMYMIDERGNVFEYHK